MSQQLQNNFGEKNMDLIKQLDEWIKEHGPSEMATLLGYKSSETIRMWVRRKSIPSFQVNRVKAILKATK